MAKKGGAVGKLLAFVAWLTGVIVALSVGFALVDGILGLPTWLGGATALPWLAGWIVVIATIVSVVLAIVNKLS